MLAAAVVGVVGVVAGFEAMFVSDVLKAWVGDFARDCLVAGLI